MFRGSGFREGTGVLVLVIGSHGSLFETFSF